MDVITRGSKHTTGQVSLKRPATGTKIKIGQWNKLEAPEMNPWIYNQLIFDKLTGITSRRKDSFSHNSIVKIESLHAEV